MPAQTQQRPAADANKPVHTARHRNLKATIWKNETSTGPMYNVTIVRSYKEDEAWRDSHSFGYDDLMNVSALMYECHAFISALRAKENGAVKTQATKRSP